MALPAGAQRLGGPKSFFNCKQVDLGVRPGWVLSGLWNERELVLLDNKYDEIKRYSFAGDFIGTIPSSVNQAVGNLSPMAIQADGEGRMVLALVKGRFLEMDKRYSPLAMRSALTSGIKKKAAEVLGTFQWAVAGDEIFAVGDVSGSPDIPGFLRIQRSDPKSFKILQPLPADTSLLMYRLGFPYVAAIGSDAFVLIFDGSSPGLYKSRKGSGELERVGALPEGFELKPQLTTFEAPADYATIMRTIERTDMITGLYSWEGGLYMVVRSFDKGGTIWKLLTIDPGDAAVVDVQEIKTKANHVTVIPGKDYWAILEKREVRRLLSQDIDSMLVVPAATIRERGTALVCR